MDFVGIVGARKYKDRQSVIELVASLPSETVVVTSGCKGVCAWTIQKAHTLNLEVLIYHPNLTGIRSNFDIPKRYYQKNRELIERCDFVHAFLSKKAGYAGGTRFEIEYAVALGKPIKLHWESGSVNIIYQYTLPFQNKKPVFTQAWQNFFNMELSQPSG